MRNLKVRTALAVSLCMPMMHAQSFWSASAVTASPHIEDSSVIKTRNFEGIHGRGVRLRSNVTGTASLYLPVTAPVGSAFKYMQIRAEDSTAFGGVKAELIAQPLKAGKLPIVLGAITTGKAAAGGMQVKECPMASAVTLSADFTYYLKLTMHSDTPTGVTAYSVGLASNSRCMPEVGMQCGPCPQPDPW